MLDSHRNLLEPRPSDRLRIGDCVLDIPLREITRGDDGEPTRITLKSEGVLLVLVANAGKVVSREALMEWVWPDTMPTDDVITQAVTQLRKALGNGQTYIETIAKQGYRLLAPVEWIVEEDTPQSGQASAGPDGFATAAAAVAGASAAGRRRGWPLIAGSVVMFGIVGLGSWLWFATGRQAPAAETAVAPQRAQTVAFQRVTAFPGEELWPSFSPDGTLLVYSQAASNDKGMALRLQAPTSATPRALTESMPGRADLLPAWSPNGREIAFVRLHEERCAVMLAPAAGGDARRLGDCLGGRPHPLAWYPDGRSLIGAAPAMETPRDGAINAVHRMRLDEGRWQALTYERAASDVDVYPKVSPDGRWIVFQRNISLGDLWRMPVGGGKPTRLTDLRTNLFGFDWTHDGKALILSHYTGPAPRLSRLDLESGRLSDYPGGSDSLTYPTVATPSGEIAFMVERSRAVVRRLDSAWTDDGGGTEIFETSASNMMPGVAPDGRQLAFMSDRTGELALWWVDQQSPETLKVIEDFHPVPRFPVRWNAVSTRFLAVGEGEQGMGLYEVDPRSGRAQRMPLSGGPPTHGEYHADADKLLVVSERGQGRLALTLYDRSRKPWRPLRQIDDVALALMDGARDRVVFARYSTAQVWAADVDLRNPRPLDSVAQPWRLRTLAVADDGVWVMDQREGCDWWWRPVGAAADTAAGRCLIANESQMLQVLSRAPGKDVLFVSVDADKGSDIGLLPASAFDSGIERVAAAGR